MTDQSALIAEIEAEARMTTRWTGRPAFAPAVLAAMRAVRREAFVREPDAGRAYLNAPLSIGHGQTISQPFIVALMTDLLDLRREHRVLEVGTGSGYQAAVLAELCDEVCSVEVIPALAERARRVLREQGYGRIALRVGDGSAGWPEHAPFDRIIVTAAAASIPPALVEQLAAGGRMVLPVGPPHADQELTVVEKHTGGLVSARRVLPVAFVPLVGGESMSEQRG
jgi:protein-L-isoaspartate(D-aspartate) O-methyltransferase